jgi:hypothetical protein
MVLMLTKPTNNNLEWVEYHLHRATQGCPQRYADEIWDQMEQLKRHLSLTDVWLRKHRFQPLPALKLSESLTNLAFEKKVTHACILDENKPKWLKQAADAKGYLLIRLQQNVWGLAPQEILA